VFCSAPSSGQVATIATPATVLAWHRKLVAKTVTAGRRSPGRPQKSRALAALVVRMAGMTQAPDLCSCTTMLGRIGIDDRAEPRFARHASRTSFWKSQGRNELPGGLQGNEVGLVARSAEREEGIENDMKRMVFTTFCLFVAPPAIAAAHESKPLVITHVTVIDATGAPAAPDRTIVVTGDRITEIGRSDATKAPRDALVIDATGKFVIPGLWDMHGHLTDATETALPLLIENGVTGVRDMGGDLDQINEWREEIESGARLGPHIVCAGPFVDGPKDAKHRLVVTTPDEARAAVESLKEKGVDFIKTHNALTRETFFAVLEAARAQGIPVAVHLPKGIGMIEASNAGAKSLEHIEMLVESGAYGPGMTARTIKDAVAAVSGDAGAKIFATFVKNGTWYVPTLVAYERGFVLWGDQPAKVKVRSDVQGMQIGLVREMHEAGVQMMTGSDFSDWALVPGIDLHNELALFVLAGFTPIEAIQAATLKPAQFLEREKDLGTIEVGKIADLVLLDMNPIEDISHTRKIHAVVVAGKLVPVVELRRSFTEPKSAR
jgi:imidazolonepropionase-like amidohydrolase